MSRLPQYHQAHEQENASILKLNSILPSHLFILRREDGGDYGVDRILEAVNNGQVTNIRSHIQIKSKKRNSSRKGNISYPISIATINYLLNSVNSMFLVFCVADDVIFWEWTRQIAVVASEKGLNLDDAHQKTVTYHFQKRLTPDAFQNIHDKLLADNALLKEIDIGGRPLEKSLVMSLQTTGTYRELVLLYFQKMYEVVIGLAKDNRKNNATINGLVALSFYQIHNYQEALRFIEKAQDQSPTDTQIKRIQTMVLCEKGINDNNKELLERAKETMLGITRSSWTWEDFYSFGNVLSGLGKYSDATVQYQQALQYNPDEPTIWKNLAGCHFNQHDHTKEMECLDRALELDENLIEALVSKATTLGNVFNEHQQAVDILARALKLSDVPYFDKSGIYYWLARFHSYLGEPTKALRVIDEGRKFYPNYSPLENLHLTIVVKHWHIDDVIKTRAIQTLKEYIVKFPKAFPLRTELIAIYADQDKRNEAYRLLIQTFHELGFDCSEDVFSRFELSELTNLVTHLGSYLKYRSENNIGADFFANFDINTQTVQKIELAFAVRFAKLANIITQSRPEAELIAAINDYGSEFVGANELCSELIIEKYEKSSTAEQTEIMVQMVLVLPQIVLTELSRQIGWLLIQKGHGAKLVDQIIDGSDFVANWFDESIEPVLKGAHNVIRWTEKNAL